MQYAEFSELIFRNASRKLFIIVFAVFRVPYSAAQVGKYPKIKLIEYKLCGATKHIHPQSVHRALFNLTYGVMCVWLVWGLSAIEHIYFRSAVLCLMCNTNICAWDVLYFCCMLCVCVYGRQTIFIDGIVIAAGVFVLYM